MANLLTREDTLFGVCQALGDDFGFNPLYLRVALAVALIPAPVAVLSFYAMAAVAVAVSRLIVREPRPAFALASAGEPAAPAQVEGDNDAAPELAQAA